MQRTHKVGAWTHHLELSSLRPQSLWELRSELRRVGGFHVTWMRSTLLSREVHFSVKAGEISQVAFHIQGVWIPQNVTVRIDLDYTYQVRLCKFRLNYLHYFKQLCDGGWRYWIGYKHNQVNGVGNSPEQRFCNAITATERWTASWYKMWFRMQLMLEHCPGNKFRAVLSARRSCCLCHRCYVTLNKLLRLSFYHSMP